MYIKKVICLVVAVAITTVSCTNNVGSASATTGKTNSATQFIDNNKKVALVGATSTPVKLSSLNDYRRNAIEQNDIVVFNQSRADNRIIYLDSFHGLRIWQATNAVVPDNIYDNGKEFALFLQQHVAELKEEKASDGHTYKPDNSDAMIFDEARREMHWLEFVNDDTWQELALNIDTDKAQVKVMQTGKLDVKATGKKSLVYRSSGIDGGILIDVQYETNNLLTNEDGEVKEAIAHQVHAANTGVFAHNFQPDGKFLLSGAPEDKTNGSRISSYADVAPDYNFTKEISHTERKIIENMGGKSGVAPIVEPGFWDKAVTPGLGIIFAISAITSIWGAYKWRQASKFAEAKNYMIEQIKSGKGINLGEKILVNFENSSGGELYVYSKEEFFERLQLNDEEENNLLRNNKTWQDKANDHIKMISDDDLNAIFPEYPLREAVKAVLTGRNKDQIVLNVERRAIKIIGPLKNMLSNDDIENLKSKFKSDGLIYSNGDIFYKNSVGKNIRSAIINLISDKIYTEIKSKWEIIKTPSPITEKKALIIMKQKYGDGFTGDFTNLNFSLEKISHNNQAIIIGDKEALLNLAEDFVNTTYKRPNDMNAALTGFITMYRDSTGKGYDYSNNVNKEIITTFIDDFNQYLQATIANDAKYYNIIEGNKEGFKSLTTILGGATGVAGVIGGYVYTTMSRGCGPYFCDTGTVAYDNSSADKPFKLTDVLIKKTPFMRNNKQEYLRVMQLFSRSCPEVLKDIKINNSISFYLTGQDDKSYLPIDVNGNACFISANPNDYTKFSK